DKMLSAGASVNFYMFCGGTNFGFHNGANEHEHYTPTITSYDYDAALTECGDLTKRFYEVREVAQKHFGKLPPLTVRNTKKKAYGKLVFNEYANLLENVNNISAPVKCAYPLTMEELGVDFGFTLYSTEIGYPASEKIIIEPIRDRAMVFIDGVFAGIKERDQRCDDIEFTCKKGEKRRIDILVENMGRVNYGKTMNDNLKGLVNPARLGWQNLFGWTMYPLPMEDLSGLEFKNSEGKTECPAFFRTRLVIEDDPCDTFLKPEGFEKGFVLVNGFNVGRYWNSPGPQKTLYIPAPLLKRGENEIILCELSHFEKPEVCFCGEPDLG
ncbi:MAG: beta-galactosidase, partial [Clostridia bacterium]|nr:beta-galactosidase [Clostridia bacterium]